VRRRAEFAACFLQKSDMLTELREQVLEANLELARRGLALYTFGNASGIDRQAGLVVIKPSGVPYEQMTAADMVVVSLEGRLVEGNLRPSSDLPTHLALYKAFPSIGGVAHTHSRYATAWAQARRPIPCLGTTHADYFRGPVPVTAELTAAEIEKDYELNTGLAIVRRLNGQDPLETPGCLVASHGPFSWGRDALEAARMAVLLEELALLAWLTLAINPDAGPIAGVLRDRHFLRKHGPAATYGQR